MSNISSVYVANSHKQTGKKASLSKLSILI